MIEIEVPIRAPSWNTLYSGKHWTVRSKTKNEITQAVRIALPDDVVDQVGYPLTVPVAIEVIAYLKGGQIDPDNVMAKYFIDAIKGWVIQDDTPEQVVEVRTSVVRSKTDKTIIRVTEAT